VITFASQVQRNINDIEGTLNSLSVINKKYSVSNLSVANLKKVITLLDEIKNSIKSEPSREKFNSCVQVINEVDKTLKPQWEQIVKRNHQDTVKMLQLLQCIMKQDDGTSALITTLLDFEQTWPINEARMKQYQLKVSEAMGKVTSLNVSEAVQKFLDKLGQSQATVSDLNTEVLQWLEVQQMSTNLSITLK
jgi:hypothetical protein